jgi:type I restriction enzyme S subunit
LYVPENYVGREEQWLRDGDIVMSTANSLELVGKVALAMSPPPRSTFGGFLTVLRPQPGLDPKFLFYQLRSADLQEALRRAASQTVNISNLTLRTLSPIRVRIAPATVQHRLAAAIESIFTRLDSVEATLDRIRRNLERYRASVLQAAAQGRLVSTEAELAQARCRAYEPGSKLLKRILAERRRCWEQAELAKMKAAGKLPKDQRWKKNYREPVAPRTEDLPPLPAGWCWATWSQIGVSQNGRFFPSKEYQPSGIRLLRPGNLHVSGRVAWNETNTRYLPKSWGQEHPSYVVGPGELVMNLTAQSLRDEFLGRICITGSEEKCLLNQRIARLRPVLVNSRFVLYLFKSPLFRRFVESLNTGSLIQHMFTSDLDDFVLPLPPSAEQERIVTAVERLITIAENSEDMASTNLARTQRLRRALLGHAFKGRLVAQNPSDEPASLLLERIRAERKAEKVHITASVRPRRRRRNVSA